MPKIKTNSGSKKRFTLTGTGKIKRKHAFHSHILTKKTKKQKIPSEKSDYKTRGFLNRTFFNTTPPQKSKDPAVPGLCFFCETG